MQSSITRFLKALSTGLLVSAAVLLILLNGLLLDQGFESEIDYSHLEGLIAAGKIERVTVRAQKVVGVLKRPSFSEGAWGETRVLVAELPPGREADILRLIESKGFESAPQLRDLPWR